MTSGQTGRNRGFRGTSSARQEVVPLKRLSQGGTGLRRTMALTRLGTALFVLVAVSHSARADIPELEYDRGSGSLSGTLPQGKSFLVVGGLKVEDQQVYVQYRQRKAAGDRCLGAPDPLDRCRGVETSANRWTCQLWRRTTDTAKRFRVRIPALRRSVTPYCFRVVFIRRLTDKEMDRIATDLQDDLTTVLKQNRTGKPQEAAASVVTDFFDLLAKRTETQKLKISNRTRLEEAYPRMIP